MHGVTRYITINGRFYSFGNLKKIESDFNLKLSDFNIDRPSFLFNKLHNEIRIKVILFLKNISNENSD